MTIARGCLAAIMTLAGIWMAVGPAAARAPDEAPAAPLRGAVTVGSATYESLMAGLQARMDRATPADRDWLQTLWTWICFGLQDLLRDACPVQYVRVEYLTTTAAGEVIPVTGLAILPQQTEPPRSMPMLAFQHPTQVERKYSPSLFTATNMWEDRQFNVVFGTLFAQSGFAVVMADYPGMGTNTNVHPYCTASLANSVVDLVRAVRDYLKTHAACAAWDGRVFLTGYSEGGYATLVAARDLQADWSNAFPVAAVAGLDGPYSLADTMRDVMLNADTNYNSPYFLPYVVNAYDSVYGAADPLFRFTYAVRAAVPGEPDFAVTLRWMCTAGTNTPEELNALIVKAAPYVGPRSMLTVPYLAALADTNSVLCGVLRANDAYAAWTPRMPLRLYHLPKDDLVPYGNSTNACAAFLRRGAPHPELVPYGTDWPISALIEWLRQKQGSYHVAVAPIAYVESILWLHGRVYDRRPRPVPPGDVDGDGRSDLVLVHADAGAWRLALSNCGRAWRRPAPGPAPFVSHALTLGGPWWQPVLADFDGDGRADPAVYQPALGIWKVRLSLLQDAEIVFPFGGAGALPEPRDYDGDRRADPAAGRWTVWLMPGPGLGSMTLNVPGALPAAGDYDGDGRADPAVYREADGLWTARLSGSGYTVAAVVFGGPDCAPAPADFDGDGRADPAWYRADDGAWRVRLSDSGYAEAGLTLGGPGWAPVPGDYDGDGRADPAIYREADGRVVARFSTTGYAPVEGLFGGPGFRPLPEWR